MRERKPVLRYGLSLLTVAFLISCGNPVNPPPPKWTSENPSASSVATAAPAKSPVSKPDTGAKTSLEALRKGEAPAGGPLKDVNFAFDSAALSESARTTLRAHADWLKANPGARVQIEGHCDERGTAEYNMALGARRAQAAMDYLVTLGIPSNRLSTISYGEEIPLCKEKTEECWARNRRARFVVSESRPTS